MNDADKIFLYDAIEAHKVDLKFLVYKYDIDEELASNLITDIVKGHLKSKSYILNNKGNNNDR